MPVTLKAVVVCERGVLLCRNPREEWELPGGWPDRTDTGVADTLRREVAEECGIPVQVHEVLDAELLHIADRSVAVVMFAASCSPEVRPRTSAEHSQVRFFLASDLPDRLPGVYRRGIHRALTAPEREH